MAVKSMTGFARSEGVHGDTRWHWEGRSVNGRGLELRFRLPSGFDALEPMVRQACQGRLARGNCTLGLSLQREAQLSEIRLNEATLQQALKAMREAEAISGLSTASLDSLLTIRGVIETVEREEDETARAALADALAAGAEAMLEQLLTTRAEEGARLCQVISDQLDEIAALAERAAEASARQPEVVAAKLRDQVGRLTAASCELDPERLHQEAALLAAKADIQEELDRLRAHVAAARDLLQLSEPVGRKLEFLAQEFNREVNTLCSKAGDIEISRVGLALKAVVDQFREQVANIE